MARPQKEAPLPTEIVPALLRYLRQRGVDPEPLLAAHALLHDAERQDEIPVTLGTLCALLEDAIDLLCEQDLALRLPAELPFRRYGMGELAVRASATVGDAIGRLARFVSLPFPWTEGSHARTSEGLELRLRTRSTGHVPSRALHELLLSYAWGCIESGASQPLSAACAWVVHARPRDLSPMQRTFGTRELSFGCQDDGFLVATAEASIPMRVEDPRLVATAEALAEQSMQMRGTRASFHALVATRVEALFPEAPLEGVAAALHMSVRTLQRRLEDEGMRYSEIVDRAREQLARKLVPDGALPLAEIGARLGFSDTASFTRAFKRWTGMPPGAFRRR